MLRFFVREKFSNITLIFVFRLIKNIDDKVERRDLEIWLETEFLKQRMTTRQNYLIRKEEMIISYDVASSCPNFMNENEKEMFFKTIHEHQNHLVSILFKEVRIRNCLSRIIYNI